MTKINFNCIIALALFISVVTAVCNTTSQTSCGTGDCQYYNWMNGTCISPTTCPSQMGLSNSQKTCVSCSLVDYSSSCNTFCSSFAFFFDGTGCSTCASKYGTGCLSCLNSGCSACASPLLLANSSDYCYDGTCSIKYCTSCLNSTTCTACSSLYKLVNNKCICKVANCQDCSIDTKCSTCFEGFFLSSDFTRCQIRCINNCKICSDTISCEQCIPDYFFSSTYGMCLLNPAFSKVANSLACTSPTTCIACNSGYTLTADGTQCLSQCREQNCLLCDSTLKCTTCRTGYAVRANGTCLLTFCQISNCKTCASQTTCASCVDLYTITSNQKECTPSCRSTDPNCLRCLDSSTCATCSIGYTISTGSPPLCTKLCITAHCSTCLTSETCAACVTPYVLTDDKTACIVDCQIIGCLTCSSAGACSSCEVTYILKNQRCVPLCQDGYYLGPSNNECILCNINNCATCFYINTAPVCTLCNDFYYLDKTTSNYVCQPCSTIPNCFNCHDSTPLNCFQCMNGYILSNGSCVTSPSCSIANCQACSTSSVSTCASCNDGYSLSNGTCSLLVCTNGRIASENKCQCALTTYLSGTQCLPCNANCLTCSVLSCTQCKVGYYPVTTSCVACPIGCLSCNSAICTQCHLSYSLSNGLCLSQQDPTKVVSINGSLIACPTGCSVCKADSLGSLICKSPLGGYHLSVGTIYKCNESCMTCSSTTIVNGLYSTCLTCYQGFSLSFGRCSKCTDPYALTCSSAQSSFSTTCVLGYTAQGGACQACGLNCNKCDIKGSGSCDPGQCRTGFLEVGQTVTICTQCFNGCPNCSPTDPNVCLSCGTKKFSNNGICQSCSTNCLNCSSASSCTLCDSGYVLTNTGSCVVPQGYPCLSYDSSLKCLGCSSDFTLTNGACTVVTCNSSSSGCSKCPPKYFLDNNSKKCLNCPSIANCKSCNPTLSNTCLTCNDIYYLDSNGLCQSCPVGCASCSTSSHCQKALPGYYLRPNTDGSLSGIVDTCSSDICAECESSSTQCTSCPPNSQSFGTTCIYNNRKQLTFTSHLKNYPNNDTAPITRGNTFLIFEKTYQELCSQLKLDIATCRKHVTFKQVQKVNGQMEFTFFTNSDYMKVDPLEILPTATFSQLTLLSVSGQSPQSASTSSSANLGLILGITLPLLCLMFLVGCIIRVKYRKETTGGQTHKDFGSRDSAQTI